MRLVFAPHVARMDEHLAHQSLADLVLDTFPYNSHSTACDALWAGVPALTCRGASLASQVAASALITAGLPELITDSLEEYAQRAVLLAREEGLLMGLRQRLERERTSCPLFATGRFIHWLESAFATMYSLALRGDRPRAFDVAAKSLCAGAPTPGN